MRCHKLDVNVGWQLVQTNTSSFIINRRVFTLKPFIVSFLFFPQLIVAISVKNSMQLIWDIEEEQTSMPLVDVRVTKVYSHRWPLWTEKQPTLAQKDLKVEGENQASQELGETRPLLGLFVSIPYVVHLEIWDVLLSCIFMYGGLFISDDPFIRLIPVFLGFSFLFFPKYEPALGSQQN